MSTVLNFDDSDSSDEEVEQHIEVQKSEAKKIIEKIESAKENVEGEPQGSRGGVDTVTDNSGSNEHNRLPAEERSGISGKKRRFVDDDDMGYSSKSAAGTVPNSGKGGGKRQRRGRQTGFDSRDNSHPGSRRDRGQSTTAQTVQGAVTSSGSKFAIVNDDIFVPRDVAVDCNSWPLYKDEQVEVQIVGVSRGGNQRKTHPYRAIHIRKSQEHSNAMRGKFRNSAPNNFRSRTHGFGRGRGENPFQGGNRGPFIRENDTRSRTKTKHNITNQAQAATENSTTEYKPIDTAALLKKRKEEKRLRDEQAKLEAENAVNFDLDEEEAKQERHTVTEKSSQYANKYKFDKNSSNEAAVTTDETFKPIDTAALLKERKEKKRKDNEKQLQISKKKISMLEKQLVTYRDMLKKVNNGNQKMELMIMNKITDASKTLESEKAKSQSLALLLNR